MSVVPCSSGIITTDPTNTKTVKYNNNQGAIFQINTIWPQGSRGTITITFGSNRCIDCSGCAAWSEIGSFSDNTIPSMNLGFIDPPFGNSFVGIDGIVYQLPSYSKELTPVDCKTDRNATRNYCSETATSTSGCLSSSTSNGNFNGANWTPGGTVIHEFGHALGMLHEHQNEIGSQKPIESILNVENVKAYYTSLTGDSESGTDQAITNVLTFYNDPSKYVGSTFDKESIMLYYLPNNWVNGCENYKDYQKCPNNPTAPNLTLSPTDKQWLSREYPMDGNRPELTVQFVDQDSEPWKIAWVIKVIHDNYVPVVGINWTFKDYTGKILGVASGGDSAVSGVVSGAGSGAGSRDISGGSNNYRLGLSEQEFAGVIAGSIIGGIFLLVLIIWLARRRYS